MEVEYLDDRIIVSYEYTIPIRRDQPLQSLISDVAMLLNDNKRADLKNITACYRLSRDIIKKLGFSMKEAEDKSSATPP